MLTSSGGGATSVITLGPFSVSVSSASSPVRPATARPIPPMALAAPPSSRARRADSRPRSGPAGRNVRRSVPTRSRGWPTSTSAATRPSRSTAFSARRRPTWRARSSRRAGDIPLRGRVPPRWTGRGRCRRTSRTCPGSPNTSESSTPARHPPVLLHWPPHPVLPPRISLGRRPPPVPLGHWTTSLPVSQTRRLQAPLEDLSTRTVRRSPVTLPEARPPSAPAYSVLSQPTHGIDMCVPRIPTHIGRTRFLSRPVSLGQRPPHPSKKRRETP